MTSTSADLVVGPLLRHVDETSASVWVETRDRARVTVTRDGESWSAGTFVVHGHHYALVELDGLEPGSRAAYTVAIDDRTVWPPEDSALPDPVIATLVPDKPLRLAFGSCRTSVGHDKKGNDTHGIDALRTYALRMAGQAEAHDADGDTDLLEPRWPDLVLFLGDQVYADETTDEMREFISARRDIEQPPWTELQDFQEYAHLYSLA
jgi:phosphodiesterase/alkaline phosphatase D-like protein